MLEWALLPKIATEITLCVSKSNFRTDGQTDSIIFLIYSILLFVRHIPSSWNLRLQATSHTQIYWLKQTNPARDILDFNEQKHISSI